MRSPVVCATMGFAGGGEDVRATEPRGVNEAVEASRLLSLRWRSCSVLPPSGAEMKSTVN
jgi:hypothetical protein